MELTVGYLKKVLERLDDDVILAHLDYSNRAFKPQLAVKRLLLLEDKDKDGRKYLTINGMGSHFTGQGEQDFLKFTGVYFDEDSFKPLI